MKRLPGSTSIILVAILLLGVSSGCRTYGDYGAEGLTVAEIADIAERFARSRARAESDLAALREAAVMDDRLGPLAEAYASIVEDHERIVEAHQETIDRVLGGTARYRTVSRLLGSIVTDQKSIENRYRSLARRVAVLLGSEPLSLHAPALYQQVPPYYRRIEGRVGPTDLGDLVRSGS